jgi:hypothetical protein
VIVIASRFVSRAFYQMNAQAATREKDAQEQRCADARTTAGSRLKDGSASAWPT